jgi:hypothetical protein
VQLAYAVLVVLAEGLERVEGGKPQQMQFRKAKVGELSAAEKRDYFLNQVRPSRWRDGERLGRLGRGSLVDAEEDKGGLSGPIW